MCDSKKQKERLLKKINNFREDLTCPKCNNIANDPVTLECLHIFCQDCYVSEEPDRVKCPVCKKDTNRKCSTSSDILIAIEAVKKYTEIIDKYWKNEGEKSFTYENKENKTPAKRAKSESTLKRTTDKKTQLKSPLKTPLNTSLKTPMKTALKTPSKTPLKTPLNTPLKTPLNTPLKTPLKTTSKTPSKPPLKTPLKPPEYHALTVQKNLRKTRSLDCIVTREKAKIKRHSVGNDITIKDKMVIDEFSSQNCFKMFKQMKETGSDKKIIDLLEEDCLANLENEFGNKSRKGVRSSSRQKRKKEELSHGWKNKSGSSDTSEAGWSRMKNTKKSIEPKGKKLKQLNISTFSTNENKKEETGNVQKGKNKSNSTTEDVNGKIISFKLDQFEAYLQENLEEVNNQPDEKEKDKPTTRRSLRRKNSKEEIVKASRDNEMPNKKLKKSILNKTDNNKTSVNTEQNEKIDMNKSNEGDSDEVFLLPTQKLNPTPSVEETTVPDEIFSMPTQKLSLEFNGSYLEDNIEVINNEEQTNGGFKKPGVNSHKDLDEITTWVPKKTVERTNSIASDVSSVNNNENIVVEVQIHRSALDNSYIKLPDNDLNDKNQETNQIDHKNTKSNNNQTNNNQTISYLQELTMLHNDMIKNSGIVQELFTILSNSKSLFSTISQEKPERNGTTKKDGLKTTKLYPTLFHNSDVVNFYNNAVPYLNNLKKLYLDFHESIIEITSNTKKLSEIFGENNDAIKALLKNNEKTSTLPSTISVNDANLSYTKIVQKADNFAQTDALIKCPNCEFIINPDEPIKETNKNVKDLINISSIREFEEKLSNNFIDIEEDFIENRVNRKLEYKDKKFKRIRKQSSDSETEPNIQKKPRFNGLEKYDNENVNIVFLSEGTENCAKTQNKNDLHPNHQQNKDEIELQKLLDTYRNDSKRKDAKNIDKDDTQDYALKYMMLLEKDYKELNFNDQNKSIGIEERNKTIDKNNSVSELLSDSIFNNILTDPNEHNKKVESQCSKSLFTESEKHNKTLPNPNKVSESNEKDQFSMSMFMSNKLESGNVLESNHLSPKDIFDEDKELDDEVAGHLSNSIIDDSLDGNDVFDHIDVVENTPQKDKPIRSFRELQKSRIDHLSKDSEVISDVNFENTDLLHIAPPPEFQDIRNTPPITPNFLSLSPDPTNKRILNENINSDKIEETQKSSNFEKSKNHKIESTLELDILSSDSFLKSRNKNMNPLSLIQKDSVSPLTIIKSTTYIPKTVISSTPKQKSILNYVSNTPNNGKNDSVVSSSSICLTPHFTNPTNYEDKMDLTPVKKVQIIERKIQKKPVCIACTRLNKEETLRIIELTNKLGLSYTNKFTNDVTHLVVSVDDRNRVKDHTMKYVSSVANGIWILSFAWIQECLAHNTLVSEEPYEVLDVTGTPGPERSRLTRKTNLLFKDFAFYCAEPFSSVTKTDLQMVITNLGGKAVPKLTDLTSLKGKNRLILTEAKISQDFDQYQNWLEEIHIITVDIEWLSRVVGQYQISSVRPFMLCLDEGIEDIGYPSSLIAVVPDHFGDTTEINI